MPFRDLVGHRRLVALVAGAALRQTLPPSLIFAGPAGVGKRRAAVALAQLFNCASPSEEPADACGHCASCRRIDRGVHADVLIVEPGDTGAIKVDQARQVIERSAYRPFEGRRRAVIVDEADAMEDSAQNALLKTLEEPPAASTFILVTARPDALLPTVRSRCQRLRFGRLSPAEVAAALARDHGFSDSDAHAAAVLADGSIGRALEEDSEAFADAREAAEALLQRLARGTDPAGRLAGAKAIGADKADREEVGKRLRLVASMLRDLALLHARGADQPLANADRRSTLERLLPAYDGPRVVSAFTSIDRALWALDRNASPKIVADWVSFHI